MILEKTIRIPRSLSVKAATVLKAFLEKRPLERLGCSRENAFMDIVNHPFFKSIDWESVSYDCEQQRIEWSFYFLIKKIGDFHITIFHRFALESNIVVKLQINFQFVFFFKSSKISKKWIHNESIKVKKSQTKDVTMEIPCNLLLQSPEILLSFWFTYFSWPCYK